VTRFVLPPDLCDGDRTVTCTVLVSSSIRYRERVWPTRSLIASRAASGSEDEGKVGNFSFEHD